MDSLIKPSTTYPHFAIFFKTADMKEINAMMTDEGFLEKVKKLELDKIYFHRI